MFNFPIKKLVYELRDDDKYNVSISTYMFDEKTKQTRPVCVHYISKGLPWKTDELVIDPNDNKTLWSLTIEE